MRDLIFAAAPEDDAPMPVAPREPAVPRVSTHELLGRVAAAREKPAATVEDEDVRTEEERRLIVEEIFAEMLADPDAAFRPVPVLFQDFLTHCRLKRLRGAETDMAAFRRRLSLARAGVTEDVADEHWQAVIQHSDTLPEDMQGVFLMLARAARDGADCPSDEALARAYGSHSPSRGRFLLSFMAERGLVTVEADFRGNRVVTILATGWRLVQRGKPLKLDDARARRAARLSTKI